MTEKMIATGIPKGCVLPTAALVRRSYRRRLRRAESVHYAGYRARYVPRKRPFASRKRVRIRPEYDERLSRSTAQHGGLSLIACADNVFRAHAEDNGECIDRCRLPEKSLNGTR